METKQNETFQKLLEQMTIMNRNLETASTAINNLTLEISSAQFPPAAVDYPSTDAASAANAATVASKNSKEAPMGINSFADDAGDQATRALGYINWNSSHDTLEEEILIKVTTIKNALNQCFTPKFLASKQAENEDIYHSTHNRKAITDSAAGQHSFYNIITQNIIRVAKETRFPVDAVYVNVELPLIKKEIAFMDKINTLPTPGVFERFLAIIEEHMHTTASFEKEHGLIWL